MFANKKFILASASIRRRFFFSKLNLDFTIVHPEVDEKIHIDENPEKYVKRITKEKFKNVLKGNKNKIIVSADTVVVLKKDILQKPKNKEEATLFLKSLSNNWHCVITAMIVGDENNNFYDIDKSLVHFKELSSNDIKIYLDSNEWIGKAGGYAVQGFGSFLIDGINGKVDNIIGFPVSIFNELLMKFNKCQN